MQTYFPPTINFSKITNPINGGLYATFTFSLVFALDKRIQMPEEFPFLLKEENPHSTVLDPACAWAPFISSLDKESFLDYGIPKLYSEWLMAGSAYGRGQKAVSVNVNVGSLSREFFVVGNSHDTGIDMIDPIPFEVMPLSWANTYGGKAHTENPSGKGMDKDSFGILHLPNVYEKSSIGHNTQKIPACPQGKNVFTKGFHSQVGFQVLPKGMGTYDESWLKTLFPAPPNDFDWKYYNLAQPPQIMSEPASQGAVFKALDNIRITNMHEQYLEIMGQIPPYNLRFFVEYNQNPSINIDAKIPHIAKDMPKITGTWREIHTQADTLWLLPNQNMGVLMWHASVPTQSEAHIDILNLAAYLEYALVAPKDARECIALAIEEKEAIEVKADIAQVEEASKDESEGLELDLKIPKVTVSTAAIVTGATVLEDIILPDEALAETPNFTDSQEKAEAEAEAEAEALTAETIALSVDAANEELAKMGIDVVVTPEAVQAKMAEISTQLDTLTAKAPVEPTAEDLLANSGLTQEQIEAVKKVTKIEPPFESDFVNKAAYDKAFEAYVSEVALTMGASEAAVSSVMESVSALDALQSKAEELTSLAQEDFSLKLLTDAGIAENDAQSLVKALQTPFPENASQESLVTYYEAFDKALNNSKASTASIGSERINQLRTVQYGAGKESILKELSDSSILIADDQKPAFDIFQNQVKELSFTNPLPADTDLATLAMTCGVTSPTLLAAIYAVDPMPFKAEPPKVQIPQSLNADPESVTPPPSNAAEAGAEIVAPEATPEEVVSEPEPYKTPTNAEEFKQALIDEVDLSSHDLSGINLTGLDISMLCAASLALCANLSLEGALLENANLTKANFSKTQLTGANLTGANLTECDLTSTNLTQCLMEKTLFDKAILEKTLFDESTITQSSFQQCEATASSWIKVQMENCAFIDANLAESNWIESSLLNVDMANTSFSHASFEAATLEACQFHGDLTRITISDSTLTNINFASAHLTTARFYTSKFIDCSFTQADLSKSNWSLVSTENLNIEKANLDKADCEECSFKNIQAPLVSAKGANFQSCDLTAANMTFLNLFNGSLRDSLVAGADFSNANLYGADLYLIRPSEKTSFQDADLTNTILTRSI